MKTVLHVLNSNEYSGAENVVITLIEAVERFYPGQYNMIYASPDGGIRKVLQERRIPFEPLKALSRKEVSRCMKIYKPDVLHAHDFTASVICSIAKPKKGCRLISHLHNNPPWIKRINARTIAYGVLSGGVDQILCVSQAVIQEFVFHSTMRDSVVVSNPVDLGRVQRLSKGDPTAAEHDVLFLGRLAEQKDPLRFIHFMLRLKEKHPALSAAMVGDGELRKSCEEAIAELGLWETITLYGFQENPYGILAKAKVLCIPSKWEGFGLVAVEAMCLGVPVVASQAGGLPDVVKNSSCGAICSSDQEFINALEERLLQPRQKDLPGMLTALEQKYGLNRYLDHIVTFY